MGATKKLFTEIREKETYIRCSWCSYDVLDDEGYVMGHYCSDGLWLDATMIPAIHYAKQNKK